MEPISADELKRILGLHAKWVLGRDGGTRADLTGADLTGANLYGADLTGANLYGADLTGANLTGANLYGANLTGANLTGANLYGANLTPIRDDLWAVLCAAPAEAEGLRLALLEGRVDGSTYEGECACLVGTLANIRHCPYDAIPGLKPSSDRAAERFFLAIRKGDTPEKSQFARLAVEWIETWMTNMRAAFGTASVAPQVESWAERLPTKETGGA